MGGVSVYGIDRALWDHPDLADEPYTQKQAWAWLIGAAAYQEKRIRSPRGPVTLQRGEFVHSIRFLALKWLWDKAKVDRFLQMLKKRDMIRDTKRDNALVYFITNYNKFQIVKAPKRDSGRDTERNVTETTPRQHRDKEKDTEDSKDNKSLSAALRAEFEERFWPAYPKKVAKPAAFKAFVKARKSSDLEPILAGTRRYALARASEDPKFTAHPATWLNDGRWDDEAPKLNLAANGATGPPGKTLEEIIASARALDEKKPDVLHS